jgi:hypothetical protein
LRPSAVVGLLNLRRALAEAPDYVPEEVCRRLEVTYASRGADFSAALAMHPHIPAFELNSTAAFRCVIEVVAKRSEPPWLGLLCRGRGALFEGVDADTQLCFERAGALEQTPTVDALRWFDGLVSLAFGLEDASKLVAGRDAERRSFEFEVQRLGAGAPRVEWVSLDDSTLGFDLRSFNKVGSTFVPKVIEVKSSQSRPPRIYITRNEWETALRFGSAYCFHVWDRDGRLTELSQGILMPHIPKDCGQGRWETVLLTLSDERDLPASTADL